MARPGRQYQPRRQFNDFLKADYEDVVAQCGAEVEVSRVDRGQWNERREFRVNGEVIGSVFKGEKADWLSLSKGVAEATSCEDAVKMLEQY